LEELTLLDPVNRNTIEPLIVPGSMLNKDILFSGNADGPNKDKKL
jgi:hypothetical protein